MKSFILTFLLFLSGVSVYACRFTIREIGYTRLNIETYQVRLEADTVRYSELVKRFGSVAYAYSINSNVSYTILHKPGGKPVMTCVNNEDNVIALDEDVTLNDVQAFFKKLLYSPLQKMMYNQIGNVFAFVIGFYEKDDHKTDLKIDKAFEQFEKLAPNLDKKVDENIMKIVIPRAKRSGVAELLRTLNIDTGADEPVVVVVYGRGRLTGEPLKGDKITTHNILNQLVTLGTDCECGIDLSPLLQRAMPFVWTDEMNSDVFKMLNIDVDNPIVLTEMSQILSKEPLETGKSEFSFVPQTIDLDAELNKNKARESTETASGSEELSPLNIAAVVIGVLLFMVIGIGLFMFFRRKKF
jgi:hypothetical protein